MHVNKNITQEELERLYVQGGLSTTEVAEKIGASASGVYFALKRFGIPMRGKSDAARLRHGHTWSLNWKVISKEYLAGATIEDLSEKYECSWATMSAHLHSNGVEVRPRGSESPLHPNYRGRIDIDVKKAAKMNKAGATLTEVGTKLGVSVQIVSKRLQEARIPVVVNKASTDEFKNVQVKKRAVARAIDATHCLVCHETRGTHLCHIQSRRKGGPLNPNNAVALCPSHHDFFDHGRLTAKELSKLKATLLTAAEKGYAHHIYTT
jgi:hypothetical protein